jgi:hypothetical protein
MSRRWRWETNQDRIVGTLTFRQDAKPETLLVRGMIVRGMVLQDNASPPFL